MQGDFQNAGCQVHMTAIEWQLCAAPPKFYFAQHTWCFVPAENGYRGILVPCYADIIPTVAVCSVREPQCWNTDEKLQEKTTRCVLNLADADLPSVLTYEV
jgi:hypothetical protein